MGAFFSAFSLPAYVAPSSLAIEAPKDLSLNRSARDEPRILDKPVFPSDLQVSPFVDIFVRPAYGIHQAVVTWKLLAGFEYGEVFVFRSYTGNKDWELLNDEPVIRRNYFSDQQIFVEDAFRTMLYRLLLRHDGREYDSPIIGAYGKLNRQEYRAVRMMMNTEHNLMDRGRQGLRVLLFTPLRRGVPAPGMDVETGQEFSTQAPLDPALDSYGQRFVGGFSKPIRTWIKIQELGPLVVTESPEGESNTEAQQITARFPSFPMPQSGDLIVHPETDNRYVVADTVQGYFFRGIIPIALDVKIQLLNRKDPRYRLPIPLIEEPPRAPKYKI